LVGRIGAEEGVREAVAVTTLSGVPFRSDANTTKVVLILADTGRLHEVRPDLPVLAQKVDGRIPVLVSSDWVERLGDSGMTFESSEATRAGIIPDDAIPGATRHFLLTDAAFASELGYAPLEPDQVLIAVEPGADTAALATRLDEVVTAQQPEEFRGLVVVSDARSELAATLSSPTVASLEGVLAIGALASLLLTMLTVVLASVAAAAARNRLVGVLRILGMSARQLRSVQAWELAPVAITAAVVGTAFGALLPVIVTGVLDLRPFVGGRSQPGAVADPLWVAGAIGAFALVVLLAGAIAGALGRRFAPAGTLKMGEG
jgi:putative ABC transport system permease protein